METLFILYVADQEASTSFYEAVLDQAPELHVPGMTEFRLSPTSKLGLMPETGIAKIICPALPDPASGRGIPRCEAYLYVDDPGAYVQRAEAAGAKTVSPLQPRNWGDTAAYLADPDGHVLAFAQKSW